MSPWAPIYFSYENGNNINFPETGMLYIKLIHPYLQVDWTSYKVTNAKEDRNNISVFLTMDGI